MERRSILPPRPSTKAKKWPAFFRLPLEIRLKIYRHCVPSGIIFDVREKPTFFGNPGMSMNPSALLNRPPFDPMCPHDFTDPGDTRDEDHASDIRSGVANYLYGLEKEELMCRHDFFARGEFIMPAGKVVCSSANIGAQEEYLRDLKKSAASTERKDDNTRHVPGIPVDKWIDASLDKSNWVPCIRALLLVSRQVRKEVLDILYGENVFRVIVGKFSSERVLRNGFSKEKVERIRHIMLVHKQFSMNPGKQPEFRVDRQLWDRILPRLSTLHIVAGQPDYAAGYHEGFCERSLADQMKRWTEELPPTLAYIGQTLSPSATVFVDVDMRKVTTGLMRGFLRADCQHIRTITGDELFQRPSRCGDMYEEWMDEDFEDGPVDCDCTPVQWAMENFVGL